MSSHCTYSEPTQSGIRIHASSVPGHVNRLYYLGVQAKSDGLAFKPKFPCFATWYTGVSTPLELGAASRCLHCLSSVSIRRLVFVCITYTPEFQMLNYSRVSIIRGNRGQRFLELPKTLITRKKREQLSFQNILS